MPEARAFLERHLLELAPERAAALAGAPVMFEKGQTWHGYWNAAGAWVWSCRPGPMPRPKPRGGALMVTKVDRSAGVITYGEQPGAAPGSGARTQAPPCREASGSTPGAPTNRRGRRRGAAKARRRH